MSRPWRFLLSPPGSGPWNMAFDEALVQSVQEGDLPIFRLYSWDPHTLSLGRFQKAELDLAPEGLTRTQMPVVRRMTGGGALYHGEDFTYSLACTQEDLGELNVKQSFRLLCTFLVETWREMGWEAGFALDLDPKALDLGVKTPVCFAGREEYDILVRSSKSHLFQKLGGNAQKRLRHVIFQHGSVPIRQDWERLSQCLTPKARPLELPSTDLASLGWDGVPLDVFTQFKKHFFKALNRNSVPWEPGESFIHEVQRLETHKYRDSQWTFEGRENNEGW